MKIKLGRVYSVYIGEKISLYLAMPQKTLFVALFHNFQITQPYFNGNINVMC